MNRLLLISSFIDMIKQKKEIFLFLYRKWDVKCLSGTKNVRKRKSGDGYI
ncbi:hypothetical protein [Alteribacillus bidgolensis]|uniref:Uncharacterized protein n=1 Tax=Alteribacillus bidgolensis TaxID=930129 RepID=A0A1G8E9Q6_9BACI|nr:hypothetical protein [Alteribacillus bidgolensis]SDH66672.1 hypothetical protein SAMN05216352_102131 [Alteribacillus bidgolensis]